MLGLLFIVSFNFAVVSYMNAIISSLIQGEIQPSENHANGKSIRLSPESDLLFVLVMSSDTFWRYSLA